MGQMKRIAMINEESFWEIASEYLYVAEDWDDYVEHMMNQIDLITHLSIDAVEEELRELWESQ
jgi:hypothetical protein